MSLPTKLPTILRQTRNVDVQPFVSDILPVTAACSSDCFPAVHGNRANYLTKQIFGETLLQEQFIDAYLNLDSTYLDYFCLFYQNYAVFK